MASFLSITRSVCLLFVSCIAFVVGCSTPVKGPLQEKKTATMVAESRLPLDPKLPIVDRVVAVVNQDVVLLSEVIARAEQLCKSNAGPCKGDTVEYTDPSYKKTLSQVLDGMVREMLILQQQYNDVFKKFIREFTEEIFKNVMEKAKKENGLQTDEEFYAALRNFGLSPQGYREMIRKQFVQMQLIEIATNDRVQVGETEVKAFYDQMVQKAITDSGEIHLYDVVIPIGEGDVSVQEGKAKQMALSVLSLMKKKWAPDELANQLEKRGLAKEFDLGFIAIKDLPEPLQKELSLASKDEVRGPVLVGQNFHVFSWTERRNVDVRSFADSKDAMYSQLREKRTTEAAEIWVKELWRKGYVEIRL